MSEKHPEKEKKKAQGSSIGRREFLKKGAAALALLPYVTPAITTFLLDVGEAEGQEVPPGGRLRVERLRARALSPRARRRAAAQVQAALARAAAVERWQPL